MPDATPDQDHADFLARMKAMAGGASASSAAPPEVPIATATPAGSAPASAADADHADFLARMQSVTREPKGPVDNAKATAQEGLKSFGNTISALAYGSLESDPGYQMAKSQNPDMGPNPLNMDLQAGDTISKAALGRNDYQYSDDLTGRAARVAGGAASAVGGALPMAPLIALTGGAAAPISTMLSIPAGGALGNVMRQGAEAMDMSPGWQTAADITGNALGGYAVGAFGAKMGNEASTAARAYSDLGMAPAPEAVRAGSPNTSILPLPSDTKWNRAWNFGALNPWRSITDRAAAESAAHDFGPVMDRLTTADKGVPALADEAQVGNYLQKKSTDWIADWKKDMTANVNTAEAGINPNRYTYTQNTYDVLGLDMGKDAAGNPALRRTPAPGMASPSEPPVYTQLREALLGEGSVPNTQGGAMSYAQIKEWRTRVGGLNKQAAIIGDPQSGQIDQLYKALSNDRAVALGDLSKAPDGATLLGAPPPSQAAKAMQALDQQYAADKTFVNDTLNRITKNGVDGTSVWNRLRSGDPGASRIKQLYDNGVINDTDRIAIGQQTLRDMGQDATGWNFKQFTRRYGDLTDEAKNNIFGAPGTELRDSADKAFQVSRQLSQTKMPSKSLARFFKPLLGFGGLEVAGEVLGAEGLVHVLSSVPAATAAAAAGTGATYALARLTSSRAWTNLMSKPVYNADKARAAVTTFARMHPEHAIDAQTVLNAMPQDGQGGSPE